MIRIESLTIEKFRGIKRLSLDLKRNNFGICGNNGTGKSGVVDAIEFALTGSVTRLTGKGMSGVTVKSHGPHVDHKDEPELARVVLSAFFPKLNKSVQIDRNVSSPREAQLSPSEPELIAALKVLSEHPECALSRREILKYVLTEPSERSKQVQALLKLDEIDKVRGSLQTIANTCKATLKHHESTSQSAKAQLLSALGIPEFKSDQVLEAVNSRRKLLGLTALTEITKETSLKGEIEGGGKPAETPRVNKAVAISDLARCRKLVGDEAPKELEQAIMQAQEVLKEFEESPNLLRSLKTQAFLKSGLDLLEEAECPFCETEWDVEELRKKINTKLQEAKYVQAQKQKLDLACSVIERAAITLADCLTTLDTARAAAKVACDEKLLGAWAKSLRGLGPRLKIMEGIVESREVLTLGWKSAPAGLDELLKAAEEAFVAIPDATDEEKAKSYLLTAQIRFDAYAQARGTEGQWKKRCDLAATAAKVFGESAKSVLGGIYDQVQKDFSRYYRIVNHDDEANFEGKLTPAAGKLGFEVDFYGRGLFPPGAYHSEGHQDGMGLCLYLALMKRLQGDDFTFAVLDDVLMSVDAGHRKEICKLLKVTAQLPGVDV